MSLWETLWTDKYPPHRLLADLRFPIEALERPVRWHLLNCPECAAWRTIHELTENDWRTWVMEKEREEPEIR
jgi:hypothetical protein